MQNLNSQRGIKRLAESGKNANGSKRRQKSMQQNDEMKICLEELKNSMFQSTRYISLVESGKMVLHPKREFVKSFKNNLPHVASERKKIASELRNDLIRYVVEKYHEEVSQNKIIIHSKMKIDAITDDIFNLSMAILEKRKLTNTNGIFKNATMKSNCLNAMIATNSSIK